MSWIFRHKPQLPIVIGTTFLAAMLLLFAAAELPSPGQAPTVEDAVDRRRHRPRPVGDRLHRRPRALQRRLGAGR